MRIVTVLVSLCVCVMGTLDAGAQTMVKFQSEDGWPIGGLLYLPQPAPAYPVPGVVTMSEPGGSTALPTGGPYRAEMQKLGMAVLVMDARGHGRSTGKKPFKSFLQKDIDGLQLDIRAAVAFLGSQKGVDPQRIGVVAPTAAGSYAVLEAAQNEAIQALVLPAGRLNEAARDSIRFLERLPVYYIVDPLTAKDGLREMAIAYSESKNGDSVFMSGLDDIPRDKSPGLWLSHQLTGLGNTSEVTFRSSDGWTLYGTLRMPQEASSRTPVAGVVLAHGSMHDQSAYYDLARDLVRRGVAVLTFDWRNKGKSIDDDKWYRGKVPKGPENVFVEFDGDSVDPQMTKIYLDVQAALAFMTSREGVDSTRIGLTGATWSTDHVMKASIGDARIKAIALFSPAGGHGVPKKEIVQFLQTSDVPILAITDEDQLYPEGLPAGWVGAKSDMEVASRVVLMSKSKHSQVLAYVHGAHGSDVLAVAPEIVPTVARWMAEKLDKEWLKRASSSR